MSELKSWTELPVGGTVQPRRRRATADRQLEDGAEARGRSLEMRQLPALLALLPRLRDSGWTGRLSSASTTTSARAASSARSCVPSGRSGWCTMATRAVAPRVLTGGEAVAEAMRQIDPDVVPVYPITPQTPMIQGFAKFAAARPRARRDHQRRIRAFRDERSDRSGAGRGAHDHCHLVAGSCTDGRGRLHRGRDARADRDGGRESCSLGPDQHPLRPLRQHARARLRRRAALCRKRSGGVRPDGDGTEDRRASGRPVACAWSARTASRSRTLPSPSCCSATGASRSSSASTTSRFRCST